MSVRHLVLIAALAMPFVADAQFAREAEAEHLDEATRAALTAALAGEHRSAANKARDPFRHPLETLEFFGLRSTMTVVEVWPGGGWYSEVLAPVLRDSGRYHAAHWPADSTRSYVPASLKRYQEKLAADPNVYDQVMQTNVGPGSWAMVAPDSADMVLSFRNAHGWMADGTAQEMFDAFYTALKPGGILGIVQHRGGATTPQHPKAPTGYVTEAWILSLAENAGFEVVGSSEINANPKDSRNHPEGVWTLPPSSRLDDTPEASKYRAIGESDRMTVKFIKPDTKQTDAGTRERLKTIIASDDRRDFNVKRDHERHPLATLEFFGIRDDMTVVEMWPGSGRYYTEILAPLLRDNGTYYAANFDVEEKSFDARPSVEYFAERNAERPDLYDKVIVTAFSDQQQTIAPAGSADMVLTFRNVHNFTMNGYVEDFFDSMYRALKPGGVLGVVEHRGNPDVPQDPKGMTGYINEAYCIELAEAAGFVFEDRSEINANPKDTKDYPEGVWSLPPISRLKDTPDADRYLAIGESDRMTLRFRKPR